MAAETADVAWLVAGEEVTLVELARSSGLPEALLRELVDYGALTPARPEAAEWRFGAECVVRVRTAARLHRDLELETPAVALALAFLERIERLESEVRRLEASRLR